MHTFEDCCRSLVSIFVFLIRMSTCPRQVVHYVSESVSSSNVLQPKDMDEWGKECETCRKNKEIYCWKRAVEIGRPELNGKKKDILLWCFECASSNILGKFPS